MRQKLSFSRSLGIVGGVAVLATLFGCDAIINALSGKEQYSYGLGVPFTVNQIYWADKYKEGFAPYGQIERADLDGQNETVVVKGLKEPDGLALDLVFRKIYWADYKSGLIQRADLNGMNEETLAPFQIPGEPSPPLQGPCAIALDFPRNLMYWTELDGGCIKVADSRDGTNATVVLANLSGPSSIALAIDTKMYQDPRRMFWTERTSGKIKRAEVDPKTHQAVNVQELLTGLNNPQGLALNLKSGKMYWVEGTEIHRANLDGSNNEIFRNLLLNQPYGIAVDVAGGHLYWTYMAGAISNDDTDPAKALIVTNVQGTPSGIALGIK